MADECHRLGAKEMSQVFQTDRAFSLGLSATPERDDEEAPEEDPGYENSVLGQALGPIIYDFTLADALKLGIVPTFTIHHLGLSMGAEERARYERLSRAISETQSELRNRAPSDRLRHRSERAAILLDERTPKAQHRGEGQSDHDFLATGRVVARVYMLPPLPRCSGWA
jgi:superfamily II DNA or RNA helicase